MISRSLVALVLCLWSAIALAQSNPGIVDGKRICAESANCADRNSNPVGLNEIFATKQDFSVPPPLPTQFDSVFCNTVGFIIVRTTGLWACSKAIAANPVWWGADPTGYNTQ